MRTALCTILIAAGLVGCANEPVDRESKLLTMAAGEAQQIPDSTQRLTRQLNFASQQMQRGRSEESKQSLVYAAQTLRDAQPGDLKPQIRIAGWVSISELSRNGNDLVTAKTACDQAVSILQSLDPVAERPQYVIGVSNEVKALQGKGAAARFLELSTDWAKEISDQQTRRVALTGISEAVFKCDDYAGGLIVLRTDSDATWRTDTLSQLAENSIHENDLITGIKNGAVGGLAEMSAGAQAIYNKPVDYQSVFSQSKSQN